MFKRWIKEPLLHFVLIGSALFAAFALLSARDDVPRDAIVVSAGKIEHLAALFSRTWQRPPTRPELEGLIDDFVREEAAYREGLAVGLDRDDTVIRRRIRQKLDFIAEDVADLLEPDEAALEAHLAANSDRFRVDPRLSFRHVYLDPEKRRDTLEADARELLARLDGDSSLDAFMLGDAILLEPAYGDVSTREITGLFGSQFTSSLAELEPGAWHGPIASGYGVHLVFIDERRGSRLPPLDEIRDKVARDWSNAHRLETTEQFYADMLKRYEIIVEWPEDAMPKDVARGVDP